MAKSKGAKKKVATPKVKTKEVPRRSALPDARTSDERICWRFAHVDHGGPWNFLKVDGDKLCWLMGTWLYGFLQGNVFHIVWWDPDHTRSGRAG